MKAAREGTGNESCVLDTLLRADGEFSTAGFLKDLFKLRALCLNEKVIKQLTNGARGCRESFRHNCNMANVTLLVFGSALLVFIKEKQTLCCGRCFLVV